MLKTILVSIQEALSHFRSNVFHTLLSVLGVVIGVAALVGILSMIDGLEKYAHDQIAQTTSLEVLTVGPIAYKKVGEIRVAKDSFPNFEYKHYQFFREQLEEDIMMMMSVRKNQLAQLEEDTAEVGVIVNYTTIPYTLKPPKLVFGENLEEKDLATANKAVINEAFAKSLAKEQKLESIIGKSIKVNDQSFQVIGIDEELEGEPPLAWIPMSSLDSSYWQTNKSAVPLSFKAPSVEQIDAMQDTIKAHLAYLFPGKVDEFQFSKDEGRLAQVDQGFLVFRLIMGFIVGISVLVGGIGVMNVLLISVTERTSEIGLRKAMGAKKRDIIVQFLAESTTISLIGCFFGIVVGVLGTFAFVPIVKAFTKAPFQAAFTANTMMVISLVAVIIGIVFGTYPAIRASRLDPVEAIRRE